MIFLNTNELIAQLTGYNKSFISRVAKQQETKYGNVDVFGAEIRSQDDIEMIFGENWIRFFFRNGKIYDTLGIGQGHKYHQALEKCAIEIRNKILQGNI